MDWYMLYVERRKGLNGTKRKFVYFVECKKNTSKLICLVSIKTHDKQSTLPNMGFPVVIARIIMLPWVAARSEEVTSQATTHLPEIYQQPACSC
jgi:hypothetical protein